MSDISVAEFLVEDVCDTLLRNRRIAMSVYTSWFQNKNEFPRVKEISESTTELAEINKILKGLINGSSTSGGGYRSSEVGFVEQFRNMVPRVLQFPLYKRLENKLEFSLRVHSDEDVFIFENVDHLDEKYTFALKKKFEVEEQKKKTKIKLTTADEVARKQKSQRGWMDYFSKSNLRLLNLKEYASILSNVFVNGAFVSQESKTVIQEFNKWFKIYVAGSYSSRHFMTGTNVQIHPKGFAYVMHGEGREYSYPETVEKFVGEDGIITDIYDSNKIAKALFGIPDAKLVNNSFNSASGLDCYLSRMEMVPEGSNLFGSVIFGRRQDVISKRNCLNFYTYGNNKAHALGGVAQEVIIQ